MVSNSGRKKEQIYLVALISLNHLLYTCYTYKWWYIINAIHVYLFVHGYMNLYNFAETWKCSSTIKYYKTVKIKVNSVITSSLI